MILSRVARVAAISFVGLLIAMIYLGAVGISAQRSSATIASVASREQSLVERYVQEVLLRTDGQPVDPNATIGIPLTGVISASQPPRNMQLAFKFTF